MAHSPHPFLQGDSVQVWSNSQSRWFQDGIVEEVASSDCLRHNCRVDAGSVKVAFCNSAVCKWLAPDEATSLLVKAGVEQTGNGYATPHANSPQSNAASPVHSPSVPGSSSLVPLAYAAPALRGVTQAHALSVSSSNSVRVRGLSPPGSVRVPLVPDSRIAVPNAHLSTISASSVATRDAHPPSAPGSTGSVSSTSFSKILPARMHSPSCAARGLSTQKTLLPSPTISSVPPVAPPLHARQPHSQGIVPSPSSFLTRPTSSSVIKGDRVRVWSNSQNQWCDDGVIEEVASSYRITDGCQLEPGDVKVSFNKGSSCKWLTGAQASNTIAPLQSGAASVQLPPFHSASTVENTLAQAASARAGQRAQSAVVRSLPVPTRWLSEQGGVGMDILSLSDSPSAPFLASLPSSPGAVQYPQRQTVKTVMDPLHPLNGSSQRVEHVAPAFGSRHVEPYTSGSGRLVGHGLGPHIDDSSLNEFPSFSAACPELWMDKPSHVRNGREGNLSRSLDSPYPNGILPPPGRGSNAGSPSTATASPKSPSQRSLVSESHASRGIARSVSPRFVVDEDSSLLNCFPTKRRCRKSFSASEYQATLDGQGARQTDRRQALVLRTPGSPATTARASAKASKALMVAFKPGQAAGLRYCLQTGVVQSVKPDSPADHAGVEAGYTMSKIDGWDFADEEFIAKARGRCDFIVSFDRTGFAETAQSSFQANCLAGCWALFCWRCPQEPRGALAP